MLESYSVALNIKEVRSNSQVLFFQIHPENRITIPYTSQYYYAHFILFLFTFSFFLFLGQHSVWTVLLWSLFCLRSVPASSVPRKFIGKYPKIRKNSTKIAYILIFGGKTVFFTLKQCKRYASIGPSLGADFESVFRHYRNDWVFW